MARQRILWVTDTLQWRPEVRLRQPANRCGTAGLSSLLFAPNCLSNLFTLSGKRYAGRGDLLVESPDHVIAVRSSNHDILRDIQPERNPETLRIMAAFTIIQ
jgi:hypothetical protein